MKKTRSQHKADAIFFFRKPINELMIMIKRALLSLPIAGNTSAFTDKLKVHHAALYGKNNIPISSRLRIQFCQQITHEIHFGIFSMAFFKL